MTTAFNTQISELSLILQKLTSDTLLDSTVTFGDDDDSISPSLVIWTSDQRKVRAELRDAGVGNRWTKTYDDWNANYDRTTSTGVRVRVTTSRSNVCKQIDTGETETIEVPDYTAVPMKTITRKITKWDCK